VFVDAKIDAFLMGLNTPRDCMIAGYIDPSNEVGLSNDVNVLIFESRIITDSTVDLQLLHPRHDGYTLCSKPRLVEP
jgi:hypothetical protein